MDALIYLMKVNLYWVFFYIWFWLLLSKHTFFKLNRTYLILSLIVSFGFPLIEFSETVRIMPAVMNDIPRASVLPTTAQITHQAIDWTWLVLLVYIAGSLYMLFQLFQGFYSLRNLINQGECLKLEECTLILLPKTESKLNAAGSFSFFKWLVISNNDYEFHFDTVLQHEQVHIKQLHSFDIMLVEVLKVFFWFNPVLWFYKSSLRGIHEYLADQQATNKDFYANFLVSYAQNACIESIANHFFNSSLLKQRIKMIYKNRTSEWLLYRYLMIVPVLVFVVLATAGRKRLLINHKIETITRSSKQSESVPGISSNLVAAEAKSVSKNISKRKQNFQSDPEKSDIKMQNSVVEDTLGHEKKRYFTNYRIDKTAIQIKMPDTSFPDLTNIKKSVGESLDFWQQESPKTDLEPGSNVYMYNVAIPKNPPLKYRQVEPHK